MIVLWLIQPKSCLILHHNKSLVMNILDRMCIRKIYNMNMEEYFQTLSTLFNCTNKIKTTQIKISLMKGRNFHSSLSFRVNLVFMKLIKILKINMIRLKCIKINLNKKILLNNIFKKINLKRKKALIIKLGWQILCTKGKKMSMVMTQLKKINRVIKKTPKILWIIQDLWQILYYKNVHMIKEFIHRNNLFIITIINRFSSQLPIDSRNNIKFINIKILRYT